MNKTKYCVRIYDSLTGEGIMYGSYKSKGDAIKKLYETAEGLELNSFIVDGRKLEWTSAGFQRANVITVKQWLKEKKAAQEGTRHKMDPEEAVQYTSEAELQELIKQERVDALKDSENGGDGRVYMCMPEEF